MKLKIFNRIYVPLFIIIWQLQNIRIIASKDINLHYRYSGFPLVWVGHIFTSMRTDIYILPALVNIVVLGIASYFIDKFLINLIAYPKDIPVLTVPAWAIAGFSLTFFSIPWFLWFEIKFYWWYYIDSKYFSGIFVWLS